MQAIPWVVAGLGLALCSACAGDRASTRPAAQKQESAAAQPAQSAQGDAATSCSVERSIGTNIPKKTCMTARQREAARQQAAETVGDLQRPGGAGSRETGL